MRPGFVHRDLACATIFASVEGNLLILVEAMQTGALESRGMNEHVLAATVRLNEAETLLTVVELNGTGIHGISLHQM
jgi:hypothetical protein